MKKGRAVRERPGEVTRLSDPFYRHHGTNQTPLVSPEQKELSFEQGPPSKGVRDSRDYYSPNTHDDLIRHGQVGGNRV